MAVGSQLAVGHQSLQRLALEHAVLIQVVQRAGLEAEEAAVDPVLAARLLDEAADPVGKSDIVKGYEYRKGEYITIEPSELEHLRVPSKHTMEVTQFVDEADLDPEFYEKPYFVVPENDIQAEAFATA